MKEEDDRISEYYRKYPEMKKQEIWRQKQIEIYYLTGRPLFMNPRINISKIKQMRK